MKGKSLDIFTTHFKVVQTAESIINPTHASHAQNKQANKQTNSIINKTCGALAKQQQGLP
jgi:hypothetical protein